MSISKGRNFSSKVLKIELSGPERSHFAILDIPGEFGAGFGGLTKNESLGITQMITSYMKKPQSIMM